MQRAISIGSRTVGVGTGQRSRDGKYAVCLLLYRIGSHFAQRELVGVLKFESVSGGGHDTHSKDTQKEKDGREA